MGTCLIVGGLQIRRPLIGRREELNATCAKNRKDDIEEVFRVRCSVWPVTTVTVYRGWRERFTTTATTTVDELNSRNRNP